MVTPEERELMYGHYAKDARMPINVGIRRVLLQKRTTRSLLEWVRAIVAQRGRYAAFGRGTFEPLLPDNRRVLSFCRRYKDEVILCFNNLARHAQYVELALSEFDGWSPMELWSGQAFPTISNSPFLLTRSGRDFFWFRLMPPGHPARLDAVAEVGA